MLISSDCRSRMLLRRSASVTWRTYAAACRSTRRLRLAFGCSGRGTYSRKVQGRFPRPLTGRSPPPVRQVPLRSIAFSSATSSCFRALERRSSAWPTTHGPAQLGGGPVRRHPAPRTASAELTSLLTVPCYQALLAEAGLDRKSVGGRVRWLRLLPVLTAGRVWSSDGQRAIDWFNGERLRPLADPHTAKSNAWWQALAWYVSEAGGRTAALSRGGGWCGWIMRWTEMARQLLAVRETPRGTDRLAALQSWRLECRLHPPEPERPEDRSSTKSWPAGRIAWLGPWWKPPRKRSTAYWPRWNWPGAPNRRASHRVRIATRWSLSPTAGAWASASSRSGRTARCRSVRKVLPRGRRRVVLPCPTAPASNRDPQGDFCLDGGPSRRAPGVGRLRGRVARARGATG